MTGKVKTLPPPNPGLPASLFVSTEIQTRAIKLPDGTESEFHFREITASQIEQYRRFYRSQDAESQARAVPYLVSVSLCDSSGTAVLDESRAATLKPIIADRFANVILEISGFGSEKKSDGETD